MKMGKMIRNGILCVGFMMCSTSQSYAACFSLGFNAVSIGAQRALDDNFHPGKTMNGNGRVFRSHVDIRKCVDNGYVYDPTEPEYKFPLGKSSQVFPMSNGGSTGSASTYSNMVFDGNIFSYNLRFRLLIDASARTFSDNETVFKVSINGNSCRLLSVNTSHTTALRNNAIGNFTGFRQRGVGDFSCAMSD